MKRTTTASNEQTQHTRGAKADADKAGAHHEREERESEKTDDEEALSAPASFPGPAMGNRQKQHH